MGVMNINVEIVSANDVGGVYPFVVACFDNDLSNEVFKTSATTGGPKAIWQSDNTFTVDLTNVIKNLKADDKPEPTYLTFFVFDTGAPGIPSLGSAGVLLATVRDKGIAKGDFPIVNGSGSLTIIVSAEKGRAGGWFQSDNAKLAGTVGAVGLGALAAGLGAMAVNKRREKKKREAAEAADAEQAEQEVEEPDAAAADQADAVEQRALPQQPYPDQQAAEWAMAQQQAQQQAAQAQMAAPAQYPAQPGAAPQAAVASRGLPGQEAGALPPSAAGAVAPGQRPWWDPETSEEDDEDPASTAGPSGAGPSAAGPAAYAGYPNMPPGRVNG